MKNLIKKLNFNNINSLNKQSINSQLDYLNINSNLFKVNLQFFGTRASTSYTGYNIDFGKISPYRNSNFSLDRTNYHPSKNRTKINYNKTHFNRIQRYHRIANYHLHNPENKKRFIQRNINILNLKNQINTNANLYSTVDNDGLRYVDNLENSNVKPIDTSKNNLFNTLNINTEKIKKRQPFFNDLISYERTLPFFKTSKTHLHGKELLAQIEKEYSEEIIGNEIKEGLTLKKYKPKVGDKIEVEYYLSLSSGKFNRFTGICSNIARENTSKFNFNFYTNVDGYYVDLKFSYYSKIIKSISLLQSSEMKKKQKVTNHLVNYKNLVHMGHKAGLILKGGKHVNIQKKDVLNLKQRLRSPAEDQNYNANTTIFDA